MSQGRHTFDTPLGLCSIGWNEDRVTRLTLRAAVPSGGEPVPAFVRELARRVQAHLGGAPDDFGDVALDLAACPPFHARVYEALRRVAPGTTTTYGELADRLGAPKAARAVGQAVARNPWLLLVPCHRVLAASGRLGGFSATGGVATKRRLLALEGVVSVLRGIGQSKAEASEPS